MSSAATNDVKTAVPIFDGSNYNVWVNQMKFWLQSQNLWRIVNGTIPQPTVSPGPPPVTAQAIYAVDYDLMHRRMGHPSRDVLRQATHHTENFPKEIQFPVGPSNQPICRGCAEGKMHLQPFVDSVSQASRSFELIHSYLKELPSEIEINNNRKTRRRPNPKSRCPDITATPFNQEVSSAIDTRVNRKLIHCSSVT